MPDGKFFVTTETKTLRPSSLHLFPRKFFKWYVSEARLLKFCSGCERLKIGGLINLFYRCNCSSLILAKLIASLSVLGLNSQISSDISGFSPPINKSLLSPPLNRVAKPLKFFMVISKCTGLLDP